MKIRGKVIAEKPGHSINAKFAQKVSEVIKSDRKNILPKLNFDKKPLMNSSQIMDGSSKFFIQAIEEAKIVEQNALREEFFPNEEISYECKESGSKTVSYTHLTLPTKRIV